MALDSLTFAGGLMMGLASSLHCAGMCGAIASSLMFAFSPADGRGERLRALFAAHAGRILMYVTAGAVLGALGSAFYGAFDHATAYAAMRWAAVALAWIGLSVAGFAPAPTFIDRLATPIAVGLRFAPCASLAGGPGAFASGLMWGFLPCGMAYAALFYAMLSGGPLAGAAVMAGFGLGTLPSVTAVALGLSRFRRLAATPSARVGIGASIAALAAASLVFPAIVPAVLCLR
jgi:sulfite exporter TauE/SafE